MPSASARDIFERQHAASRSTPAPDVGARRASLSVLLDLVESNTDALVRAIAADFGVRCERETQILDVIPVVRAIRHSRKSVRRWMRPEPRRVEWLFQPARAWIQYEPLGVMGILSPWNFPLLLCLVPLANALAAGNRAMLKPSELTPAFSALLAKLVSERFDPAQVAVIEGGVEVAREFSRLPFDHLVFTGSTAVGREVMRAAAENLTPVTLELGGKSPAVVDTDFPLARAARSVAFGKWLNAGQTCVAPDYALVPADRVRDFAQGVLAEVRRGFPSIANGQYTSLITERHRERLAAAVAQCKTRGVVVMSHGESEASGRIMAPTVVLDPPPDCLLMREEIFGPVLPIVGYGRLEDALAVINERGRPLALYCFTHNKATRRRILGGATSGGVMLNGTLLHAAQDDLPFGGVGPSGMGSYHGQDGFRRFSHARPVYAVGAINGLELLGPPWGSLARLASRFLLWRRG